MGVKASLQRAWEIGQWTDVVLVGGDHTEVGRDVDTVENLKNSNELRVLRFKG